jgi:hypothetical protein
MNAKKHIKQVNKMGASRRIKMRRIVILLKPYNAPYF